MISVTRATACITVVWSRLPNLRPISGRLRLVSCFGQVHRHLARTGDGAGPPGTAHIGEPDAEMLGDALLDFLDRHPAVMRLEDVVQHFLRGFEASPGG